MLKWLIGGLLVLMVDYEAFHYGTQLINSGSDLGVWLGFFVVLIPLYLTVVAIGAIVNRVFANFKLDT